MADEEKNQAPDTKKPTADKPKKSAGKKVHKKITVPKAIRIGSLNISTKFLAVLLAGILIILIIIIGISAGIKKNKAKAVSLAGYSFNADAYTDVKEVVSLNEKFAVYTDSDGKKGILLLDGTVAEEADEDKIYAISDRWRNYYYVCEGPRSEYKLLIDETTGKIGRKQYNGITEPEEVPVWSFEQSALVWKTKDGLGNKVTAGEIILGSGYYPVETTDGTYIYINNILSAAFSGQTFEDARDFSEGLAAVKVDGKWGYIDETGEQVIKCQYYDIDNAGVYSFRNGLAVVRTQKGFGFIDRKGNEVTAMDCQEIIQGSNGKYIAKKNSTWGILTLNEAVYQAANTGASETETSQAPSNMYVVEAQTLNMRSGAGTTYEVVTTLPIGAIVTVTESADGWAHVTYGEYTGWVSSEYIAPYSGQ